MSAGDLEEPSGALVLEYRLDEPPEKVWRAISIPALREAWLPGAALADPQPTVLAPGEAISYRMREDEPPFLESVVTFRVAFDAAGGTRLHVIHVLAERGTRQIPRAANGNAPPMLRAA